MFKSVQSFFFLGEVCQYCFACIKLSWLLSLGKKEEMLIAILLAVCFLRLLLLACLAITSRHLFKRANDIPERHTFELDYRVKCLLGKSILL